MRIISGYARGIKLLAPDGLGVRPTTDRVRESLFGMLGDLTGVIVVDLFAGAGTLGLEALSRGAEKVFFVENNPEHLRVLAKNLTAVIESISSHPRNKNIPEAQIIDYDAFSVWKKLPELAGGMDLIFADPPYKIDERPGAENLLLNENFAIWAAEAMLVVEHHRNSQLPWHPKSCWKVLRRRDYGESTITLAERDAVAAKAHSG